VVGKVYRAVMGATREQIVKTPTAAIALVNWLRPELRPNAGQVSVNVAVGVNVRLDPDKARELEAAYFAALPE
jgi:hypothetical protein